MIKRLRLLMTKENLSMVTIFLIAATVFTICWNEIEKLGCGFNDLSLGTRSGCYFITEEDIYLAIGVVLVSFFAGWAINFIMSGHKSPLPWEEENNS